MNLHTENLVAEATAAHRPTPALSRVLSRLPEDIRASLTHRQRVALDAALDANNPTHHVINLRVTLFGLVYLVILAGRERRGNARRAAERKKHPLSTPGNIAILTVLVVLGMGFGYALRILLLGG